MIGAGIVGASSAWHLASRGLSVIVLEKDIAPAMGSTGKSAAGVRVQFTTEANIRLSMHSLRVYREFEERHGHVIAYQDIGYLVAFAMEPTAIRDTISYNRFIAASSTTMEPVSD